MGETVQQQLLRKIPSIGVLLAHQTVAGCASAGPDLLDLAWWRRRQTAAVWRDVLTDGEDPRERAALRMGLGRKGRGQETRNR